MGGYAACGVNAGAGVSPAAVYNCTNAKGLQSQFSIYFFSDGHAKALKPGAVSPGSSAVSSSDGQDQANFRAAGTANMGGFQATFSTN